MGTKCVEEDCSDLWGQSMIFEAIFDNCSRPRRVQGITEVTGACMWEIENEMKGEEFKLNGQNFKK